MSVSSLRSGSLTVGGALMAGTLLVVGLEQEAASSVRAGACVDGDLRAASCTDERAVYEVLTTVDDARSACPQGDYFERRSGADLLCLGFNVAAGDCVQDDPAGPVLVRCTTETRTPTFRVLKVVEDRAASSACRELDGDAVSALTYSVPGKTLCIVHQPLASATG